MTKSKFSENQIISILKQVESGRTVAEVCRDNSISTSTYFKWKAKYSGLEASDLKRMRDLEEENRQLKRMFADLSLENRALKDVIEKKAVEPVAKKAVVAHLQTEHQMSERRACRLVKLSRTVYRRKIQPPQSDAEIQLTLAKLAAEHSEYGFKKMFLTLRRAGNCWNHKRVYRVYCAMKLNIKRKHKRRLPTSPLPLAVPNEFNQVWSADFMSDALSDGRRFRTFNVIDDFNREVLAVEIDTGLGAQRVIRVLDQIAAWRGLPVRIRFDNGPELTALALAEWAQANGVELEFIKPGKPMQNGFIERFNRSFREAVLDRYIFETLEEVKSETEKWVEVYNQRRPHEALNNLSPMEYLQKFNPETVI